MYLCALYHQLSKEIERLLLSKQRVLISFVLKDFYIQPPRSPRKEEGNISRRHFKRKNMKRGPRKSEKNAKKSVETEKIPF
jgi:hypothetical protein